MVPHLHRFSLVCVNSVVHCRQCPRGYILRDGNCWDVDECGSAAHDCGPLAACKNLAGSFQCECLHGYHGDGYQCDDTDECASSDSNDCSRHADCINKQGSFQCVCRMGFHGNGRECQDDNECDFDKPPCHPQAVCVNFAGGYDCQCKGGFYGDGHSTCLDRNECLSGDLCPPQSTCVNTHGSYQCPCWDGYEKQTGAGGMRTCQGMSCFQTTVLESTKIVF